jgi:hypothetical protein
MAAEWLGLQSRALSQKDRGMRCCSFVVFLLIAWSPAPAAEKDRLADFSRRLSITPCLRSSEVSTVRIPVRAVQGTILTTDLTIQVTDVVGPNGRPEFLSPLFTARLEKGDDQHGPSLLVEAQSDLCCRALIQFWSTSRTALLIRTGLQRNQCRRSA